MAAVDNPSGAHTDTLVTDNEDGTYSVSYTPFEEGIHTLSVKFGGDHIPGSPFKVSLQSISWGDMHRLQRLAWLVERAKERTTEQCSQR